MSEPVGNAPRGTNIPGNAHKNREVVPAVEPEPREKVEKVIEGTVVTRKQPWWKRAGRSIVADDAQSVGEFIMGEVVIPAIKNLIAETVKGSTDRLIYGSARPRGRSSIVGGGVQSLRTRYDKMNEGGEPRHIMGRDARARHDFDDVILSTRSEAVDVIERLIERVERYNSASVADLYDFVGVTGSFADQRWGWTDLRTADVRQVRGGFLLDLPRPESLR